MDDSDVTELDVAGLEVADLDERLSQYNVTYLASAEEPASGGPEDRSLEDLDEPAKPARGVPAVSLLGDVVDVVRKIGSIGHFADLPFASEESDQPVDPADEGSIAQVIDLAEYQRARATN